MQIAFIGVGRMGSGMARNLISSGHNVVLYNRTRSKAEELGRDGVRIADSLADAVGDCDAVVTMLADDHAVEETVFGLGGIVSAMKASAAHVSCSTISTKVARRLAAEHENRRQLYLSAPVFGRPDAADRKQLLVVVAGASNVIAEHQPIFDAIGRHTFIAGTEPWQANAVKLCGNFMIASMIETFGEAFATLRKANIDPHLFLDVMNALFMSPVYANYGRMIADEQFEPTGFALRLGLKDITLALATAHECVAPMPFASLIRDHFLSAVAAGLADHDWSALAKIAARNAGL